MFPGTELCEHEIMSAVNLEWSCPKYVTGVHLSTDVAKRPPTSVFEVENEYKPI